MGHGVGGPTKPREQVSMDLNRSSVCYGERNDVDPNVIVPVSRH